MNNGKSSKNYYQKKNWHKSKKKITSNEHNGNADRSPPKSLDPIEADNVLASQSFRNNRDNPYHGWTMFFCDKEYKPDSPTVKKVQAVLRFLQKEGVGKLSALLTSENLDAGMQFPLDIKEFYTELYEDWPDFKIDLQEDPNHTLNCIKLAMHQKILDTIPQGTLKSFLNCMSSLASVRLKIVNYQHVVSLRDLKINSYGKLMSTKGCVIRVGRVKQVAQWFVFSCVKCGLQKLVRQLEGNYTVPKKCDMCGVSKFKVLLDSSHVRSIASQMIKIQEPFNDDQDIKGRMPRTLDVQLEDDLVDSCMPGDDIQLTGVIKLLGANDAPSKATSNSFSLYMEAVTLVNSKHRTQNITENDMSVKDHLAIKEVHDTPDIFRLLIHSLCPSIYGHEMIKAGLMLGLFGGNIKNSASRNDIHVLVVGDPGLGKSQMLQACARIAVKGVYTCGNSSTSTGLTVALTREVGTADFALEPGALVLADRGCCCIDEFDKMPTQQMALLECMEQQTVSIAKSGVVCTLPARTAILAAANPIGGRYDKSKTILQNLNMSQPLLSRFDLVFLLLDQPDTDLDNLLCQHVMSMHQNSKVSNKTRELRDQDEMRPSNTMYTTLRERLESSSPRTVDVIPHSILRKYISYARQNVDPVLSKEAAGVIQDYYLELRSGNQVFCDLPVYTRQLEAMIRLTEARAKVELRTEATKADALEVIEILRYTMNNTLNINVNQSFVTSDSGKITQKKVNTFMGVLKSATKSDSQRNFSMSDLKELAANGGIVVSDFARFISRLNDQGILLKTGKNSFRFISE